MRKSVKIFLNTIPILFMLALIPLVSNDYLLTAIYSAIIILLFTIQRKPKDIPVFVFGFFAMIFSEYLFVSTGAEIFVRHSLLGIMPLWLPPLWGYGFVAIKRTIAILG